MKDSNFINERLKRGQQANEKVEKEFSNLTTEQLNWKPAAKTWSIAECLQHLIIADSCYFGDLKLIASDMYQMTFWERYSPFSGLLGKVLKSQMKEQVTKKMVTHTKLTPTYSTYQLDLLDNYKDNLRYFMDLVSKCHNADLDKFIINSPTITWITYSLRDALEFLFEHEHRHINQAIRVTENERFPK
ncbi:DinB family protein [Fulvivirgaceae bacterium BMA12]|uniref:DinB family protein n=1 Tax=Agaribacillus aureus TaxID=3051825 RepID=A0ABT8LBX6_9BACT|nr:DinB family protein [Fulvivirgaceae bacterium BMA12]